VLKRCGFCAVDGARARQRSDHDVLLILVLISLLIFFLILIFVLILIFLRRVSRSQIRQAKPTHQPPTLGSSSIDQRVGSIRSAQIR
jgi:hypothetical protein